MTRAVGAHGSTNYTRRRRDAPPITVKAPFLHNRLLETDQKVWRGEREDAIRLQPYKEPAHLLGEYAIQIGYALLSYFPELLVLASRVSRRQSASVSRYKQTSTYFMQAW